MIGIVFASIIREYFVLLAVDDAAGSNLGGLVQASRRISMRRIMVTLVLALPTVSVALNADDETKNSLWTAAKVGDAAALVSLLAAGTDVNASNAAEYGKTALHLAAEKGHVDVVRALIAHKADLNAKDSFYKDTALGWAVYSRHGDVVSLLLEAGSEGADAALTVAQRRGDSDLMRIVLAKGNVKPETLSRCLTQAKERPEMISLLEQAGAKLLSPPGEVVSAELIAAVTGAYSHENGGTMELAAADGKLLIKMGGQSFDEWRLAGSDTFLSVANPATTIRMERDGDRVVGFVMTSGEAKWSYKRRDQSDETPSAPVTVNDTPGEILPRNWPSFRGQHASGVADHQWPPIIWDAEMGSNVRWKTPIPGLGNSCPIVWKDSIFITSAVRADGEAELKIGSSGDVDSVNDSSEHSWRIFRLDKQSGRILWEKESLRGAR
jgi:Ankyrin repeats (3 copies)